MTKKQSSSDVSSIAAKYVRMRNEAMYHLAHGWVYQPVRYQSLIDAEQFFRDIRKLAASVLSQDERKGQGK